MKNSIWLGFDPREAAAYAVARSSIRHHLTQPIPIRGVVLSDLMSAGLYTRPLEYRVYPDQPGRVVMWDVLSDAPMSTQHANARFLVPHLAKEGWALFIDGDILVRGNLARIFDGLSSSKAVYCVQHRHEPVAGTKMDGQIQTKYARKNWSSAVLFNCDHEANRLLTIEAVNTLPGRDLHRFCWLEDDQIGELGPEWNYLVGHTTANVDPQIAHFTSGTPDMAGYENVQFADEWRERLNGWAAHG